MVEPPTSMMTTLFKEPAGGARGRCALSGWGFESPTSREEVVAGIVRTSRAVGKLSSGGPHERKLLRFHFREISSSISLIQGKSGSEACLSATDEKSGVPKRSATGDCAAMAFHPKVNAAGASTPTDSSNL